LSPGSGRPDQRLRIRCEVRLFQQAKTAPSIGHNCGLAQPSAIAGDTRLEPAGQGRLSDIVVPGSDFRGEDFEGREAERYSIQFSGSGTSSQLDPWRPSSPLCPDFRFFATDRCVDAPHCRLPKCCVRSELAAVRIAQPTAFRDHAGATCRVRSPSGSSGAADIRA
jgi:hypothetical protein